MWGKTLQSQNDDLQLFGTTSGFHDSTPYLILLVVKRNEANNTDLQAVPQSSINEEYPQHQEVQLIVYPHPFLGRHRNTTNTEESETVPLIATIAEADRHIFRQSTAYSKQWQ